MTENVIHLVVQAGDGYHVEADKVLDGAKEARLSSALIIGWDKDHELYIASSDGVPENLLLMEVAKRTLIDGYFED